MLRPITVRRQREVPPALRYLARWRRARDLAGIRRRFTTAPALVQGTLELVHPVRRVLGTVLLERDASGEIALHDLARARLRAGPPPVDRSHRMSEQQSLALTSAPMAKPSHHDLDCGCRVELDPAGPAWLTRLCSEHAAASETLDYRIGRVMDAELDELVKSALTGRALVPRLQPKDPYR